MTNRSMPAVSVERCDDAEENSKHQPADKGRQAKAQGIGQRSLDQLKRGFLIRQRETEIALHDVAEIGKILLQERSYRDRIFHDNER